MDLKNLPPAMVSQLVSMVEEYINSSRTKYAPQAAPLTDEQRSSMQPFFSSAVLDSARLCMLRGAHVTNPSMYPMAKIMGIRNLPDFAEMAAVTFVDVIVSQREFTEVLLFHELVHVVQYAQMGVKEFAAPAGEERVCARRPIQQEWRRAVFCGRRSAAVAGSGKDLRVLTQTLADGLRSNRWLPFSLTA
jgi:hypothetical protein